MMNLTWASCKEPLLERFYSGKVTLLPVKTVEEVRSSPEEPVVILSPILKYKSGAVQKCVEMSQGPNDLRKKFDLIIRGLQYFSYKNIIV